MIYHLDSAFPVALIFLKPTLFLSNWTGSVTNIANAIKAKESVVNLAMPQSDDANAKIVKCMNLSKFIIYIISVFIINLITY